MNSIRATLVELYSRVVKVNDKDNNIYLNGENNLYPNEIERVINNSPTASRSQKIMSKFIAGDGITEADSNMMVNKKTEARVTDIIARAADDIAYQYGVFFWRSFGIDEEGEIVPNRLEVLDYAKCRISKEDDEKNEGKIFYKDYETKKSSFSSAKKVKEKWFYPYSENKEVILAQMKADAPEGANIEQMIKSYRGQAYYLNLTPRYKYALSPVDSVFNEADTEFRMSTYTNTQTRLGFLGKTLVLSQEMDEEKAKELDKTLKGWLGAEESADLMHYSVEQTENLDQVIKVVQLQPQFNDKLFEATRKDTRKSILGAFNNIPEPLFMAGDTLFGTSGDTYREMKLFYNEQTEGERKKLAECITKLGFPCQIKPLIEEATATPAAEPQPQV